MPEFRCSLCSLPFGSVVGVKVHYSKMHGKESCGISNIDDSRFFDYDQLFELCEVFGGEDVNDDIVLENNSINMENQECIPESARKQKYSSSRMENVQKKNQKEDLNNDVGSENCDVEPDENVMFWDNNDDTSISNKTEDIEEITLEINPDDQVDFDIFLEEQLNKDHCFAEVINDDKEEMHEVS